MIKRSHILPILIYLSGLGSLLLSDILVTKYLSAESVSTWAEIRSLVGIASVICLVGLDQAFIRSPQSSWKLLRALTLQIPLLACGMALIAQLIGINNDVPAVTGLCIGAAGSLALFQYFRTHNHKMAAQVAQQFWKHLIFLVIVASIFTGYALDLSNTVALTMLGALVASAVPLFLLDKPRDCCPEPMHDLYRIGSRFMVTSLLLSLAVYAEQLVVSSLGQASESALYFTHSTYFLFPISVVNGYIAFNIAPWIRVNRARFIAVLRTRRSVILLFTCMYALVVHIAGWLAWISFDPQGASPDETLQSLLLASCVVRTLYMLPAGYLGVYGAVAQHDRLIRYQVFALAFSIALFALLYGLMDWQIIHATAAASLINWILRTLVGFVMMHAIERLQST